MGVGAQTELMKATALQADWAEAAMALTQTTVEPLAVMELQTQVAVEVAARGIRFQALVDQEL